jgi:hypothetical protein
MLELIYVSAAVKPFSVLELRELMTAARIHNQKAGLTGLLLHDRGSFLQVLEGEPVAVETLFNKISRDFRHGRVTTLLSDTIPTRSFDAWNMGFVSLDARLRGTPGFSQFLEPERSVESFLTNRAHAAARQILLAFREGRFRSFVDV